MKTNPHETNRKFWLSAAIGLALLFMAATPRTVMAQWATNGNNINNTNTGNVGIGTNAPDQKLVVSVNSATTLPASAGIIHLFGANGVQPLIAIDGFATAPVYLLRRANTSAASPSALQANDNMGVFGVAGYGSTGYQGTRARVGFFASENWTNSANGTYMVFNTTSNGAATAGGTERMRIDNAGNVGIGTAGPNARLTVSANTGTPPTSPSGTVGYFANVDGTNTFLTMDSYMGGAGIAQHSDFLFRAARGTLDCVGLCECHLPDDIWWSSRVALRPYSLDPHQHRQSQHNR